MKKTTVIILFIILLSSCNSQNKEYRNYDFSLATLLSANNTSDISINIDKSDYKLTILIDTIIIKEYPVVFGGNPVDDKLQQGDECTPEGKFKMISKYPHKKWSKFIWINYPTTDSWKKHNKAKTEGKIPKDAKIGGQIGIHGVPVKTDFMVSKRINWTLGCISLKNKDINEIYPYITKSTIISIEK